MVPCIQIPQPCFTELTASTALLQNLKIKWGWDLQNVSKKSARTDGQDLVPHVGRASKSVKSALTISSRTNPFKQAVELVSMKMNPVGTLIKKQIQESTNKQTKLQNNN